MHEGAGYGFQHPAYLPVDLSANLRIRLILGVDAQYRARFGCFWATQSALSPILDAPEIQLGASADRITARRAYRLTAEAGDHHIPQSANANWSHHFDHV